MGVSAIHEQRDIILNTIRSITRGQWKVMVVDESSKKIVDNVVKEDDILNENIANIEKIEDRREMNPEMDAIYLLSPQPHIVECLMADFERRRYHRVYLLWIAILDPELRRRIDTSRYAQEKLAGFETLTIDYFPRESHLVTFRDPWSFPILYHPACNNLVREHMQILAQKITGICVSLGEYPKVRYYRPQNPLHEASVLCSHLARFVQEELDAYRKYHPKFPPPAARPQGILLITDRSMDLSAPLIHEFTYQAMAHDLLPIRDGEKVLYKTVVNEGNANQEEKEMEIGEKDKIWVENRHRHMKDTIEKLMGDFQKFMDENPHFVNSNSDATTLGAIKDMLAGLPQFQEMKEAYSLHLSMAQECMNIFQNRKLPDIASVEQSLATGLDEDFRKPKNLADQLVRLLDDPSIAAKDRLRLIILYIMYRDGLITEDIQRLLAHADLPTHDAEVIYNLDLLGARSTKALKDNRPPPPSLFQRKTVPTAQDEEYSLSRFEPALKPLLEDISKGILSQITFPYTNPPLDNSEEILAQSQASLRSAKPTWARGRGSVVENRQRIIIFMAGGATFSESRVCYEISKSTQKDVFLATSHMLTPAFFVRQVADLSQDRRKLDLPSDRRKPEAPAHLFPRNDPKPPPPQNIPQQGGGLPRNPAAVKANNPHDARPPTQAMQNMNLNLTRANSNGITGNGVATGKKMEKDRKKDKSGGAGGDVMVVEGEEEKKKKKKRGFFGSKK